MGLKNIKYTTYSVLGNFTLKLELDMAHQHVVHRNDDTWAVRGEGNTRDTSRHDTQHEAQQRAKEIATNQGGDVITHGLDGKIRARDSYGNDPFPPHG